MAFSDRSWRNITFTLINDMTRSEIKWKAVGVVVEGSSLRISDVNVWDYTWTRLNEPSVELPPQLSFSTAFDELVRDQKRRQGHSVRGGRAFSKRVGLLRSRMRLSRSTLS
jgi:hypothetical protein